MTRIQPAEETGRILALTVIAWGFAVAIATFEGVFAKLGTATLVTLAVFAALYVPAMYRIDHGIRDLVLARPLRELALVAVALDAALAIAYAVGVAAPLQALFGLPLALAAQLALVERLRRPLRSARARSPGARPAAS